MENTYIAVFDSGVGGLTVLRALRAAYPTSSFLYLGDTAHVPYGTKSVGMVTRYSLEAAWFLNRYKLHALVIACNTASSIALSAVRASYPDIPVMGVIEPGSHAALESSKSKKIAILGTPQTIASGAYQQTLHMADPSIEVTGIACPLFVPLAEEGLVEGDLVHLAVEHYLKDKLDPEIDTIILGCTHYPLLKNAIQEVVGENVNIVDSAEPLARELREYVPQNPNQKASLRIFTTDFPHQFQHIATQFLGTPVVKATHINLEEIVHQHENSN